MDNYLMIPRYAQPITPDTTGTNWHKTWCCTDILLTTRINWVKQGGFAITQSGQCLQAGFLLHVNLILWKNCTTTMHMSDSQHSQILTLVTEV